LVLPHPGKPGVGGLADVASRDEEEACFFGETAVRAAAA
jgi:hypothetical protein